MNNVLSNFGIPKFESVVRMQTIDLRPGDIVETISYADGWQTANVQPVGAGIYNIITATNYTLITGIGTADGNGDHVLTNGNVAMLVRPTNPHQYGAIGNGVVDDTAKFASLEASITNSTIDLEGGTYLVAVTFPHANIYVNGTFEIVPLSVPATVINPGDVYVITSLGTTDFTAIGAASNTVGAQFTASGIGTGTGVAGLISDSTGQNVFYGDSCGVNNTYEQNQNGSSTITFANGNLNTAFGSFALNQNTEGRRMTAFGADSLRLNTTGEYNTGFGAFSLADNTTGINNTAVGTQACHHVVDGSDNTAVGTSALITQTSASFNTAVGSSALLNSNANNNTAVGRRALQLSTGVDNTAVGSDSATGITSGNFNTMVGKDTGGAINASNGQTFIGHRAGLSKVSGDNTTLIGKDAGISATIALNMVAVGFNSLAAVTDQSNCTAIGHRAGESATGPGCTAVGAESQRLATSGSFNTSVGFQSLFNTSGNDHVAIGRLALTAASTGNQCVAVGSSAGAANTTGVANTYVGYNTGATTNVGSNNTLLGNGAETLSAGTSDSIVLGNGSIAFLRCNVQVINSLSDKRDKTNIKKMPIGIEILRKLKPVEFNMDRRSQYDNGESDGSKQDKLKSYGFLAQDFKKIQDENELHGLRLILEENPDRLEAAYSNLIPLMVSAMKDMDKTIVKLVSKINKLEGDK